MQFNRTTILALVSVLAFAGTSVLAQTAKPDTTPKAEPKAVTLTAEQILDKAVDMSGGRAAYEKHSSLVLKGNFSIPAQSLSGTIEVFSKAPNMTYARTTIPGIITQTEVFDGTNGWSKDSMTGLRTKTASELAVARRSSVFNADLKWRELWKGVELVGRNKVGERDAYVVKFIPKDGEGSAQTNYYDAESFLLLRSDLVQESPMGTMPVTTLFSDYRPVGGIKTPFSIEYQTSLMTMTMTVTEVNYDVAIEDSMFVKPQ
jgi:hypothetical protein